MERKTRHSRTPLREKEAEKYDSLSRQRGTIMKHNFPMWHITLPLAGVLIFAIGTIGAMYVTDGRYLFQFEASPEKIRIRNDVDKRNNDPAQPIDKQENKKNLDNK